MQTRRVIRNTARPFEDPCLRVFVNVTLAAALVLPGLAVAQVAGDATATACGFLTSIQSLLNAVSVVVVTIAIIFSGYQIAFAHKRIADVAPVMIGAILIGAAGQIAKMFLSGSSGSGCTAAANFATPTMNHLAIATQWLLQHA
jgi:type IV secretion system protein VirB2